VTWQEEAVYRKSPEGVVASPAASGPWDPAMQHGAAPAALAAWAAEQVPSARPMQVSRLTLDLLRPVPLTPLTLRTRVIREGRRIQIVQIDMLADGVEVLRSSVLKIRIGETMPTDSQLSRSDPERLPQLRDSEFPSPFIEGVEMRVPALPRGRNSRALWYRLKRAIIAGERTSPLMRAAATADFCNGTAAPLDPDAWTFVNADLSVHLSRPPESDWILLEAQASIGPNGRGFASGRMTDTRGPFAFATQSLVVEQRDTYAKER
jgi:acyl-CoA thioesterase